MFGLAITPWKLYAALGAIALAALLAGTGVGVLVHKVDDAKYQRLIAGYKTAEAEALKGALELQKKQDGIALAAAVSDAASQQKIVVQTRTITQEVVRHVQDHSTCVTFGFIRVLDAAVLGVTTDDLALAPGQSDDTCAPVGAVAVAQSVAANYGLARQNAQQLDDLEDFTLSILQSVK